MNDKKNTEKGKYTRHYRRTRRRNKRPTIGLLTKDATHILLRGVSDAARDSDVNLITFLGETLRSPHGFEAQANVLYDLATAERLDALIIWTAILDWFVSQNEMETFCRRFLPLPVVVINDGITYEDIPCILTDHYQGMRELITHLIEIHGYRRIAFIRGPEGDLAVQDRYRAYIDTLAEHDIPVDPNLVTPPCYWDAGFTMIQLLLEERQLRPPTDFEVLIGASDGLIVRKPDAWEVFRERGIHIPDDIGLAGADDYEEGLAVTPPLTTVRPSFYEAGQKAVEMVLAWLRGEHVPMQVKMPSEVVLRQSCGCLSSTVIEAATELMTETCSGRSTDEGFVAAFAARRQETLARMTQGLGVSVIAPEWMKQLLDAFSTDLEGKSSGMFLSTLNNGLQQVIEAGGDVASWHGAISALRRCTLPYLTDGDISQVETLWQQARIMIGEAAQRAQAQQRLEEAQQAKILGEVGQALRTTPDLETMICVAAQELPRVGISRCYLSLYEDSRTPAEWSRLILAYNETGFVELETGGQHFPSRQLAPDKVWPQENRYSMVVEALYFRENQLGFALFAGDPQKRTARDLLQACKIGRVQRSWQPQAGTLYAALRGQLSSALQGALLVQRIQEHAAEITRKNYILDTFMANVPDAIYFKDRNGCITHANPAHTRRHGFSDPVEEIGKSDYDFFPEEQARKKYDQEQEIMRTGQPLLALEEPDGLGNWSLTTKMPLRDEHGDIIGTFGISRDITSLKHTQAALERAYTEILALNDQLSEENRRYYMKSLLLGTPSPGESAASQSLLPDTWTQPYFCVVLVKLLVSSPTNVTSSARPDRNILAPVLRIYEEYAHTYSLSGMLSVLTPTEVVLILNVADPVQIDDLCTFIVSQVAPILKAQNCTLIIGIGEAAQNPDHLSGSYDTARTALFSRINMTEGQIISYHTIKKRENDALLLSFPFEQEQKLISAVLSGHYSRVVESVNEILAQNVLERSSYQKLLAVYMCFLRTAAKILIRAPGSQEINTLETSLLQTFRETRPETIPELRKRLLDLFHQLTEFYPRYPQQRSELLKEQLLTYISTQYTDPNLSLDSLARVFNLSSKYLSRWFKEQIGMNYLDYLTMLRINRAKQLLMTYPEQKVGEICEQVGFFNPGTFIKTFKRREGVTPGTYRRRISEKDIEKYQ